VCEISENQDFERAWLAKFSTSLDAIAGEEIRNAVMLGSENLSSRSSPREIIAWSKGAMERLDSLVGEQDRKAVMAACACQYPKSDLQPIRERYEATRDVDLAHRMLQEQFESFLRNSLGLSDELIADIVQRGWGAAGVKQGHTIIATKIPKSGYLVQYMQEPDPQKKRQYYCHRPRIRDVLENSGTISPTYCYCGAGFYKGIWEEILQKPVEVEVLETILKGDGVCKIAIHLPSDA
jgi:hypothetical protein